MTRFIDLHVHTTASDGSLTPAEVVRKAEELELAAVAITDHDTTAGVQEALAASRDLKLEVIAGVELSVVHQRCGSLHILGYYIDAGHPELGEELESMRDGRDERNLQIMQRLGQLGLALDPEKVKAHAGGEVVGRPHLAQEMVAAGHVESVTEAFDRYLARGKPAYVERKRMTPEEAIQKIKAAGGVVVLAHPGLIPLNREDLDREIAFLVDQGVQGLEAHYPDHSPAATRHLIELAEKHRLAVTGGTDFHGQAKPEVMLGQLPVPEALLAELRARRRS